MGTRFKSSNPEHQIYEDHVTLHIEDDTELVTGIGPIERELPGNVKGLMCILDITSGVTGDALDLFDVFVQTRISAGVVTPVWVDVVHFTQHIGTDLATRLFAGINLNLIEALFDNAAALAAGAVRDVQGDLWRCRWDIVDGGGAGTHTWAFSVGIQPMG